MPVSDRMAASGDQPILDLIEHMFYNPFRQGTLADAVSEICIADGKLSFFWWFPMQIFSSPLLNTFINIQRFGLLPQVNSQTGCGKVYKYEGITREYSFLNCSSNHLASLVLVYEEDSRRELFLIRFQERIPVSKYAL